MEKDFIPSVEDFKTQGVPVQDYCEVCKEGDKEFYMLDNGITRYYYCSDCETISTFSEKCEP